MPDFGRPIKFGYFLLPTISGDLISTAQEVERLGLDYVAVQDHPYVPGFVDTWTLLSVIAGATSRVTLLPDVANLPLRPPAVLAKAAATLDLLSGGRFELGLGAGAMWDRIAGFGGPRRTAGEALDALAEAIHIIRQVWSGEPDLRFAGKHYHLGGAQSETRPAHDIGIWLGVYGPRALALTARMADGWIPSFRGDLTPIVDMTHRLDEAAARANRNPGELRRILNIRGTITAGESTGMFDGPPEQWAANLTDLATSYGFDTFVLWTDQPDGLHRFAQEVVPLTRSQIERERA